MARLNIESQAAPAAQGPIETQLQELAMLLALVCATVAFANPGVLIGACCAWAWRRLYRPSVWRRLAYATAVLIPFVALRSWLVVGWPWINVLGASFPSKVTPVGRVLAMRSLGIEALFGPIWFEAVLLVRVVLRRRVDQQIRHDHRLDQGRWHALTGRRQRRGLRDPDAVRPSGRARSVNSAHPRGRIRLCVDLETNRPLDLLLPEDISTHVCLPGATGTGKTTTLARLGDGVLANGYGAIFVDCKGGGLGDVARRLAERYHLPFYLVDPDAPDSLGYNPCSGDPASVANKLIGAFSYGPSAEIYKNIAMETLPVLVRGLQAVGMRVTMESLYEVLAPGGIAALSKAVLAADHVLAARLLRLSNLAGDRVGLSGQAGLRHRLGALLEGKFGPVFRATNTLEWEHALATPSVTYIALSALASSEDVELMGRVLAQDQKQICARRIRAIAEGHAVVPVLAVWDEFAALKEADQLVDLLLQARQALMPTVVSTQFLPETVPLRKAVLGSGLLIAHRVEGEDAEAVANQFGTRRGGELTSQVDFASGISEKGSLRRVERYLVHPNELRNFTKGQAALRSVAQGRHSIVQVYRDSGLTDPKPPV
jgi:hypothetical protein